MTTALPPPADSSAPATATAEDITAALQYRLTKMETALLLERRLRRSKDEQTQVLRQRVLHLLTVARQARAAQQSELRREPSGHDPDATILSQPTSIAPEAAWAANTRRFEAAPQEALPANFRLHEYRIDRVLGQGGFGITYLATDVNLNTRVAIKEYMPAAFACRTSGYSIQARSREDISLYQSGLDHFLVEARTLATFRHPHIVRVARFFEAHQTAYIVLEYEKGQSLKSWWPAQKNLPEAEILTLLRPLLDGLSQVHEAGYLHRDIKPDNIYVRDGDGSLVLLDFGAARHSSAELEELGAVVTPGYAPPEQYVNGAQGPYTDIYALGACLYWLVSGRKPPPAPERQQGVMMATAASFGGQAGCPYGQEFLQAIDWALTLDPAARPQSMAEFARALFAAHGASLDLQSALQLKEDEDQRREFGLSLPNWRTLLNSPKLAQRWLAQRWQAALKPRSWPLALKMILALTFSALLPMLITAYYNLYGSVNAVSSSELRNLERLAQSVAGRIGQMLGDSQHLANYLATDDAFINYLNAPDEAGKKIVYEKINHLQRTNPDVHRVLLIDQKGLVLIANDPAVVGRDSSFRDYFRSALAGKPFMTSVLISITDASPGIFYSNPVYAKNDTHKVIGVIVLRIKGSTVDHLLQESTAGTGRIPFLVDGDGVIISHTDSSQLYKSLVPLSREKQEEIKRDKRFGIARVESLNMPQLAAAMQNTKKRGHINYTSSISGAVEHAGYAPVPGHNWVVGITEPRSQFEAPLQRLFVHVLYSVLLVGGIFILLAIWFARTIVRPVLRLTEAANALKAGDYEAATLQVSSNDEIGKLARTFNVMIDVLRQRERERGKKNLH